MNLEVTSAQVKGYAWCMLSPFLALSLGLLSSVSAAAQPACDPMALPQAAHQVAELQKLLHDTAVPENDPEVPREVATQLMQLKDELQQAARAAFACAPGDAEPEAVQKTLTEALHTHPPGAESTIETHGNKDIGTYGAELEVQVFPLYGSPRYYEVDFRYGVECGDDNLLMIFGADKPRDPSPWHQVLRWDAPRYTTVGDAFGDFTMMTPLSGFPGQRNWRFVVARGKPGCGPVNGTSEFTLDVLEPTADPAHPTVVWHLQHPYVRSQEPRLSTTEDTLTFELSAPSQSSAKSTKAKVPSHPDTFRFHISKDNHVEALPATDTTTVAPDALSPAAANTHSPQ